MKKESVQNDYSHVKATNRIMRLWRYAVDKHFTEQNECTSGAKNAFTGIPRYIHMWYML